MTAPKRIGQIVIRVDRGFEGSPRRLTVTSVPATGRLAEEDLRALIEAEFPASRRRRRQSGKKASGKGRSKTKTKASTRASADADPAGVDHAKKPDPESVEPPPEARSEAPRQEVATDTLPASDPATVPDADSSPETGSSDDPNSGEPFEALRAVADASGVPEQAEALWTDEVLDLLGHAAEQLAAQAEEATAEYAEALAGLTRTESVELAGTAELEVPEPEAQELPADDRHAGEAPRVFDAEALGDEVRDWEEPRANADSPPSETESKLHTARSLQALAAEMLLDCAPRRPGTRAIAAGPLLVAGLLLLGWAGTCYIRTGDLRIALGMLAWATCTGCALALFQQRAI